MMMKKMKVMLMMGGLYGHDNNQKILYFSILLHWGTIFKIVKYSVCNQKY
jgi:hypothetical protein